MPIYEYKAAGEGGCRVCRQGFELRRPSDRQELAVCPICKSPVARGVSLPSTPRVLNPLSVTDAKKAGFAVYEKRDAGVYERQ